MVIRVGIQVVLLAITAGVFQASHVPELVDVPVNIGQNVTLTCEHGGEKVMWVKEDRSERMSQWRIQADGSLSLPNVARDDSGVYKCAQEEDDREGSVLDSETISARDLENEEAFIRSKYRLIVRTPPGELVNVTVKPSTVLALLQWQIGDTGGCDISYFTARFRRTHEQDWQDVHPAHISPTARLIDVYHLNPNSTYKFEIWAVNEVGPGEKALVEATTHHVVQEIELARHLLEGADTFDTRVWVAAVAVVMGTLLVLSIGTCYLMCKDYHITIWSADEQEIMELVPNIILNPGFLEDPNRVPDENLNDQPHVMFNNNSIIRPNPMRV